MSERHRFRIVSNGNPFRTAIEMDGKPLHGVTGLSFAIDARDRMGAISLTILGHIEVEGDFGSHEILSVRQNASAWRDRKAPKAGAEVGR